MSDWINADYFKPGFWTEEQNRVFAAVLDGSLVATTAPDGSHRGPYITNSVAELYQSEFVAQKLEWCNSGFMDTVLDMLEDNCPDVGKISCMFSQSLEPGHDAKFVQEVQGATLNRYEKKKLHERRFLASFFNIKHHWYWYVIDHHEKVCYTGDSFNQLAFVRDAQQKVHPQPLLSSILRSYRDVWKYFTKQNAEFITRAVQCPSQLEHDNVGCGQLACASVLSFLMRIQHENLPTYKFAQPITNYDAKNAAFIKERLVMSFAHGDFRQRLVSLSRSPPSKVPVPEVATIKDAADDDDEDEQPSHAANNVICYRVDLQDMPMQIPTEFLGSLDKFYAQDPPKPTNPTYQNWTANPKEYLERMHPGYFSKSREVLRTKVFIHCGCNPDWYFRDQKELLVSAVALHSNVKKKGNNATSAKATNVPLINSPNFTILNLPALKENVIAYAALKWCEQHGVMLENAVWRSELKSLRSHHPRSERPISKSKGVFKVTEYGFTQFLKSTSPTEPGPCIFIEVQNCKGRKKKSDSEKLKTRTEQRRLPFEPKRSKTWITIVMEALQLTPCPQTVKSIYTYLQQTQPALKSSINQVRQGLYSGQEAATKREAVFFSFEVAVGKSSLTFGGLLENYKYRELIPQNATQDENGKHCIIWKNYVDQCDITGCLAIVHENSRRVFSLDGIRLYTKVKIFCGTFIEMEYGLDNNSLDPNSMLCYVNKTTDASLVNIESYIHFGMPVMRTTRDIGPGEYIYQMDFDFIGAPLQLC